MKQFTERDLLRLLRNVDRSVMTGAISQLGLKVKQWDPDEALDYAGMLVDNLPLPIFVGSYLSRWFPNYRIILQAFIANSLIKFLSALPGDEIEVKNLIAPEYQEEVDLLPEPGFGDPSELQAALDTCTEERLFYKDLSEDSALRISELEQTESDLRQHIRDLHLLAPDLPDDPAPPDSGELEIALAEGRALFNDVRVDYASTLKGLRAVEGNADGYCKNTANNCIQVLGANLRWVLKADF